jgi:hypothetical protein
MNTFNVGDIVDTASGRTGCLVTEVRDDGRYVVIEPNNRDAWEVCHPVELTPAGWFPGDTAPRQGDILVVIDDAMHVASFGYDRFYTSSGVETQRWPDYWRPLPLLPVMEKQL